MMWTCESTASTFPHRGYLPLDCHLAVGEWLVQLGRNEQKSCATRCEPAGEQLRRATDCRFGEQRLRPTPNVAQLRRAPREETQRGAETVRRAQKMRHRVAALGEDVRTHSRLIVEQGTFVWVGGWRIHARAEVYEHVAIRFLAFDDDRRRVRTEARGMHEIVGGENADLGSPLKRGERLIQRQPDGVVVSNEARSFTGALKKMGQRIGAIFEGPQDAGCRRNGHLEIITEPEFNC